jgi:hypothetical protein
MPTKPLVRWTAGPVRSRFDDAILRRSVGRFVSLYGDALDYVVCINGREREEFESLGIKILRQSGLELNPKPKGVAWKLYPPRIRMESHEIFIDHDLVLAERLAGLDLFLESADAFLHTQSPPGVRNYGRFDDLVPDGFRLNSGLFGLPPNFQFDMRPVGKWSEYFDEQGFVASVICRQSNVIQIGIDEVWICDSDETPRNAKAYHFVHDRRDESWIRFLKMTTI